MTNLSPMIEPLLCWYDQNGRTLPWRENAQPYRVWVSEIMLQQTRVEAVKPYFDRFMLQLPTIADLAEVEESKLLKLWEGLGYYNRARNLQKTAKIIMEKYQGVFPSQYEALLSLPGIGEYTAGAIASICFGKPIPAVDGNVQRVLARLTENYADVLSGKTKKAMTQQLAEIYPKERCGDFTQSLMELGATICMPTGIPKCIQCPISEFCEALKNNTQLELPVKAKKKPRKKQERTVFLLCCAEKIAVQQRAETGLLGGLFEFPNVEKFLSPNEALQVLETWGICVRELMTSSEKKHIFTHIEWHMKGYLIVCEEASGDFLWVSREALEKEIVLPTAFKIFCTLLDFGKL